jgi:hypothetical protein
LQVAFVDVFVLWMVGVVVKSWMLCVSVVFGWWFVGLVPFWGFLLFFVGLVLGGGDRCVLCL